jgi:thiol-disulfide isomerase/thioredoxin
MMQRRMFLKSSIAAALVAGPAYARTPFAMQDPPQPLLSPPFQDGDGRKLKLSDFAGRVVLLNVWATWCPPCREEMPALDALQTRLGGPDFAVVPISIDAGGLDAVGRFYDEIGIRTLGRYWGEDLRVKLAFAVFGLPTSLLIDRNGNELGRLSGPARWDSKTAIDQISQVIASR